ncbi:hypothetical protein Shyhy02_08650 [Streptomyces hygroscopicus subsp. hygroscopicus]|nr:hypothetical protein Shyhy02_08650 [Streptomyces hygroscopicus subsp. hygroscopicus]
MFNGTTFHSGNLMGGPCHGSASETSVPRMTPTRFHTPGRDIPYGSDAVGWGGDVAGQGSGAGRWRRAQRGKEASEL